MRLGRFWSWWRRGVEIRGKRNEAIFGVCFQYGFRGWQVRGLQYGEIRGKRNEATLVVCFQCRFRGRQVGDLRYWACFQWMSCGVWRGEELDACPGEADCGEIERGFEGAMEGGPLGAVVSGEAIIQADGFD